MLSPYIEFGITTVATDTNRAECGNCGAHLAPATPETEAAQACPNCGSTRKNFFVSIVETLVLRDGLGMKARRVGQKKPFAESLSVTSASRSLGKLVHHERLIDRDNDLYHEKVTEYETGNVIHEKREPLSQHVGHGSAKKRAKPNDA